jgi:choline dehydrogenase
MTDFDVVIVGAGSAGAALAARLTEDPARTVLLVEAGPDYPELEQLPDALRIGRATATLDPGLGIHDWRFVARATAEAPEMQVIRGKATGGSSAVNGQIFLRGMPDDYDGWRELGNDGWGWSDVLPFFLAAEADRDYRDPLHGSDGPIGVRRYREESWTAPTRAFVAACRAAGFADCPDANTPGSAGVGPWPMNNPDGIRVSTALGYLPAARGRDNFTLRADTLTRRVVLDGGRAAGVELEDSAGGVSTVTAGEVVLSAGAIGTPQLLMLSGVGPREQLDAVGIPVAHELPGVGQSLRDHPMAYLSWQLAPEAAVGPDDPLVQAVVRYSSGSDVTNDAWITGLGISDLLFVVAGVHAPRSTGELRLVSPDVRVQPSLDYRYLSDERDYDRLLAGVRLVLELARHDEIRRIAVAQLNPTPEQAADDDELAAWVRRSVTTSHHVSGTCRMGGAGDPEAVVAPDGRVHGVERLRVVDASIFPRIPRAPTNATTVMVAERIAALMRDGQGRGG